MDGKLDRDSTYRIAALYNAVARAGQDGGLENTKIDVLLLAEAYYGWLIGEEDSEKPILEGMRENKK